MMMALAADKRLITQAEAARRAGVHRATIKGWLAHGKLTPQVRELDGRAFVDADELTRKLESHPVEGRAQR